MAHGPTGSAERVRHHPRPLQPRVHMAAADAGASELQGLQQRVREQQQQLRDTERAQLQLQEALRVTELQRQFDELKYRHVCPGPTRYPPPLCPLCPLCSCACPEL